MGDIFHHLGGLQRTDYTGEHTQGTCHGFTRRLGLIGKDATVAGCARQMGEKLALKLRDAAVDKGLAQPHTGIVDEEAGRKVVSTIYNEIVAGKHGIHIIGGKEERIFVYLDMGVESADEAAGRGSLALAYRLSGMDDLALQVGNIHLVAIHYAQSAHSGCRQILEYGRTQASGSYHQHTCLSQKYLPLLSYFRQA